MNHPQHKSRRSSSVFAAAAVYFGIVFGVGFVLGSVRVPFLVPRLGQRVAELLEMPLMFMAVLLAAGYVVRRYEPHIAALGWALVGFLSLCMLVAAELLLAVALAGRGVGEYIASRDPVSGAVYLVMLLVFAAMPWLRRRQSGRLLRALQPVGPPDAPTARPGRSRPRGWR